MHLYLCCTINYYILRGLPTGIHTQILARSPCFQQWAILMRELLVDKIKITPTRQECALHPLCYALAGALCATCTKIILPSQLMTWWDKVLGVRSVDIAQHSKAPR